MTLPGQAPINITYHDSSNLNSVNDFDDFITTRLEQYTSDEYIESTLNMTVVANVLMNQTQLECLIEDLGNDSVHVLVKKSGNMIYT